MGLPKDKNGREVRVGSRVRLLELSGSWFDELPQDEIDDVRSMINGIFQVEEIDEHGVPWIRRSWLYEEEGKCHSHSIGVASHEMELIDE